MLWLPTLILTAAIVVTPLSTAGQAVLGLTAVVIVAALKPWVRALPVRFLLLATASLIVLRYWAWRVTDTLPEPGLTAAFAAGVALLLVETCSILVFFLNAFITADPTDRPLPGQSGLTVIVNGVAAPPLRPSAFGDFAAVTVPVEALRPGENHVRVEMALHHRIYCGPEASYALWDRPGCGRRGSGAASARHARRISRRAAGVGLGRRVAGGGAVARCDHSR